MDSFFIALNAVIPFMVYLAWGFIMRRAGVTDEAFLKKLNNVVFKAFFPFIMFWNIYKIDPDLKLDFSFVLIGCGLVLITIILLMIIAPRFIKDRSKAGTVIQAIYRSNCMLYALPLTVNVFGESGSASAVMMLALVIPIYNVSAVIILEHFSGKASSPAKLAKDVVTNPLLIGAAVGLLFHLLRIQLPGAVESPISAFNAMSTPIALFVLGGTLRFTEIGKNKVYLFWGIMMKMVILPAIVIAITALTPLSPVQRFVIFSVFGTPVAASSYPMAQNMGGDGELAGQYVVISTVLSVFTLFLWIFFMGKVGLL